MLFNNSNYDDWAKLNRDFYKDVFMDRPLSYQFIYPKVGEKMFSDDNRYNVLSHGDGYMSYEIEVPGYRPSEIDVSVSEDNILRVVGTPDDGDKNKLATTRKHGFAKNKFTITERLPQKGEITSAILNSGILTIYVKTVKPEQKKSIKIEVTNNS